MERLNHSNDIEIKLLPNRCFLYANRRQNIVITAEHLATEITVLFPDEYEKYSKRVDFINSQGKEWTEGLYTPEFKSYKLGTHKCRFHFSLPTEVTTEGELKMQFLAYLPDESMTTVPFEVIPIYVQNGMLAFKRNARSNPDLLILAANKSEQALFNSQKALAKSEKSLTVSNEAKQIANSADNIATSALDKASLAEQNAVQAIEIASLAKDNSVEALGAADNANTKSDTAVITANEAENKAAEALTISASAEEKAENTQDIASEALTNSQQALSNSDTACDIASNAESIAENAMDIAQDARNTASAAESNSETALAQSGDAINTANLSIDSSNQAKSDSNTAMQTANSASSLAQSVVDRANSGEFKGEKGETGDRGPPGEDGFTFAVDNLIGLYVDDNGDFFAYASETATIDFRYDEESGDLFLIYL